MYIVNLLVYYNLCLSFNMNLQGQLLENKCSSEMFILVKQIYLFLIMYRIKK